MATYSELQISFNQELDLLHKVKFDLLDVPLSHSITLEETWQTTRTSSFQVTKGIATSIIGERSAMNYVASFELDYNTANLYEVSRVGNIVTIKCTSPFYKFLSGIAIDNSSSPGILNIVFVSNNGTGSVFDITNIAYSGATNPCDNILVSVTTNELATDVITPNIGVNTSNPFTFEMTRATNGIVKCKSAANIEAQGNFITPPFLNSANISFNMVSNPVESTVTIAVNNTSGLILQYSINNTSWQASNVFILVNGNYTIYVKDQYGCNVNKLFSVTSAGNRVPYEYLSKSNSIRYANRIDWNNNDNHKTLDNSLSYEAEVPLPKMEIQQFQSNDVIPTHFKSNYMDLSAVVINEDQTETNIPIVKKTNYIGLKDKRDARIISTTGDPTKTGIYFDSGNLYDYDTGIDTGEDYALNGALPKWGMVGYYIEFNGSWFLIEDVLFDEDRNVDLLIITNNYFGANDATIKVSSLYDLENYEVYEYDIDFANYIDKQISVRLNQKDPIFPEVIYLSELIDVRNKQFGMVEIRYRNETNTDILYSTGIEHKIRIPIHKIDAKPKASLNSNDTDTSTILLSAQSRQVYQYTFHPVTEQKMETLVLALLHETILINGEYFVSDSPPEIEGALGDTNWYIVKANMTKTNSVYNSQTGGSKNFSSGNTEIPNLIQGSSGFIKY